MKAGDLMIGDWVNVGNDKFAFPDQIYSLGYDEVDSGHGDMVGTYRYDELFPIPLTPEIFRSIGFKDIDHDGDCDGSDIYWLNGDGYSINTQDLHLHCVHELQHALRLCGIEKEIVL